MFQRLQDQGKLLKNWKVLQTKGVTNSVLGTLLNKMVLLLHLVSQGPPHVYPQSRVQQVSIQMIKESQHRSGFLFVMPLSPLSTNGWAPEILLTVAQVSDGFPGDSVVKNPPVMWETRIPSLGQEDPLEKELAICSSILTWKIPWTEEPGRATVHGVARVRHDLVLHHQICRYAWHCSF